MADIWGPVDGVYTASTSWLPSFGWSVDYWSLFTTITGALAGAGLGAWAAQKIAKNEKERDESTKELRSVNSGIVLSYNISNTAMSLKKQHVRGLKDNHDKDIANFEALQSQPPPRLIKINPQFVHLGAITTPIAPLQGIVLEQMASNGSAINSAITLADAIDHLNRTISLYNDLLDSYRQADLPAGFKIEHLYLGIPVGGKVNNIYRDTLASLSAYTDDVIFFALKLCDDLIEHGQSMLPKHRKLTGNPSADITDIDISDCILEGLIPQHEPYMNWLAGFSKKATPTAKRPWLFRWLRK
ncbi:hypothetical protein LVV80_17055 [Pseudomonas sp. KCA11]|uniref:hypothetical protein n=1 Tax=Pseudomonas sp. KCA11 TaxID=2899114 RepID=UPI001F2F5785|nr:hypothetical protein [Pseudomonas sp. KCA11]MCE5993710.1 hypothetical protein [Pseudomonas sp. KCA11]